MSERDPLGPSRAELSALAQKATTTFTREAAELDEARARVTEMEGEVARLTRERDDAKAWRGSADALADEVAVLVDGKLIDARSPAADALLDCRDPSPPRSDWSTRIVKLEAEVARLHTAAEEARAKALEEVGITPSDLRCLDVAIGRLAAGEPVESVATDYDGDELRRWIRYVGEVQTRALADERRAALEEAAGKAAALVCRPCRLRMESRTPMVHPHCRRAERLAADLRGEVCSYASKGEMPCMVAVSRDRTEWCSACTTADGPTLPRSPDPEAVEVKCRCGKALNAQRPACPECGGWVEIEARTPAPEAEGAKVRRHSTNEHGDCPHWCEACRLEREERERTPPPDAGAKEEM